MRRACATNTHDKSIIPQTYQNCAVDSSGHGPDQNFVDLVIQNLTCSLEINRDESFIVTITFIACEGGEIDTER